MKLVLTYNNNRQVDIPLDKKITKAMESIGFELYASGCNNTNGKRDLAFIEAMEVLEEDHGV